MAKLEDDPTRSTTAASEPLSGFASVRDLIQSRPAAFIEALGEPLYAIGSNVQLFGDPHARADLLALDAQGVAVVVVVERDGEHWLLEHGLMCAGMVAGWKPEFFFRYPGVARAELQSFLRVPGEQINRKQRVVLVAHSHDYAVFSAAGWLAQRHDIEIWCVRGEIDAASGRLVLSRAREERAGQESRVDVEPLVFPPSPPTAYREQFLERDPGPPHEPVLDPVTKTAPNLHRLQGLGRPAARTRAGSGHKDRPKPTSATGPLAARTRTRGRTLD